MLKVRMHANDNGTVHTSTSAKKNKKKNMSRALEPLGRLQGNESQRHEGLELGDPLSFVVALLECAPPFTRPCSNGLAIDVIKRFWVEPA